MKIVVLAGGISPERDVSLTSGSLVANALINKGHKVMLLDLLKGEDNDDIKPLYYTKSDNHLFNYSVPETEPDLDYENQNIIGPGVIDICKDCDIVFLALHGGIGENGTLQEIFDKEGISYTGSDSKSSKLAMDKEKAKEVVAKANILVAKEYDKDDEIDYPVVVKPNSGGSSVGTSIVHSKEELFNALNLAKKYEDEILIEKYIKGREFSVGILNGIALPSIEIIPKHGFYDYKNKYQKGATIEVCPSDIDEETEQSLRNNALICHKALGLGYYSRIDFILDDNNDIYFLEANTLPGMTPTSLLPQEAKAFSISYEDLCEKIVLNK